MSWQKCPICNGSGQIELGLATVKVCPTCNGARIISEINGLPPPATTITVTNSNNPKQQ